MRSYRGYSLRELNCSTSYLACALGREVNVELVIFHDGSVT